MNDVLDRTPYELVSAQVPTRVASKAEMVALTRRIEREALAEPPSAVVATLQDARFLTERTRSVYARLAEAGTSVVLQARGLQSWLAPGVTGVALDEDHPLVDQWCVVVVGPRPVAFAATDLGPGLGPQEGPGPDLERSFRYGLSPDPDVVLACARVLRLPV